METDPGESTDYIDFPIKKPFINNPSTSELRSRHDLPSPPPTAIPVTNSASIISALESLQTKIKELELHREKTLHDLEDVSKRVEDEGMQLRSELSRKLGGSFLDKDDQTDDRFDHAEEAAQFEPSPASLASSSRRDCRNPEASRPDATSSEACRPGKEASTIPPLSIPASSTKQSRTTSFTDQFLNLDYGEKIGKTQNEKFIENGDVVGENETEDGGERLSSNPSTPRNVKEASQRGSAIGKQLAFMEKEYGTMSDSLQNLRTMAGMSRSMDKVNSSAAISSTKKIVEKSSRRRSNNDGSSTLMAMQNLEKERASLKISQSLAEARIRALERELENNRLQKNAESSAMTPEPARANVTEQNVNKSSLHFAIASPDINGNTHPRIDFNANESPGEDLGPELLSPAEYPNDYAPEGGQTCLCDHPEPMVGVRRGRERLCEMQNRLSHQRPSSKSPLRRSPGGRTTPDRGNSRCHYRLNMKHVPFVVGKSTTASHSLTANIQTLVAKLKSHDSGLCDHIRQLHEIDASESSPPAPHPPAPHPPAPQPPAPQHQTSLYDSPRSSNGDKVVPAPIDPSIIADPLKEIKNVLDALQDEFAAMSFEHHELSTKLKALGVDHFPTTEDVRSASQDAEIVSIETQLGDLVAKMNIKGKQIKVLKKILKGLKEKGPKPVSSAKSSVPNGKAYPQSKPSVKTKSKKATEVQLGKGKRVDVQEGIMVQCIPSTTRGARDLLYGIKDLHRSLKEADICWQ